MLFELTEEIANALTLVKDDPLNPLLFNINQLFASMIQKKHIVWMNRKTIKLLASLQDGALHESSKLLLKWIATHLNDIFAIKSKLRKYVILTLDKNGYEDGKYYLSLNSMKSFQEAKLLTENGMDFDFYLSIGRLFYSNNIQSLKLSNDAYYGTNIVEKIQDVTADGHYVLIIVDSDRKYPVGKCGVTCKLAKKALQDLDGSCYPIKLLVPNVKEKENLFPFEYYNNISINCRRLIKIILNFHDEDIMRYIDIKDEFTIFPNDAQYMNFYKNVIDQCVNQKLFTRNCLKVKGVGNKAIKESSQAIFDVNSPKKIKKMADLDTICKHQCYIINEWKEIAQNIFDFGCCLSENVIFNV